MEEDLPCVYTLLAVDLLVVEQSDRILGVFGSQGDECAIEEHKTWPPRLAMVCHYAPCNTLTLVAGEPKTCPKLLRSPRLSYPA